MCRTQVPGRTRFQALRRDSTGEREARIGNRKGAKWEGEIKKEKLVLSVRRGTHPTTATLQLGSEEGDLIGCRPVSKGGQENWEDWWKNHVEVTVLSFYLKMCPLPELADVA